MGMYPQPNKWQCGPFALKHALIMLGVVADEEDITRLTKSRKDVGTDETQLRVAARHYKCGLPTVARLDPDAARRTLRDYLRRNIPVLICIDQWSHWITVVKTQNSKFILLDSDDRDLLHIVPWEALRNRWVYTQKDEYDPELIHRRFDLHPVVPRFRARTRAQLSIARVRHLRRPENQDITRLWNQYVEDLLDICRTRTPLSENILSLGEFFRRHGPMILDQVTHWHGDVDRKRAERVLKHLHFVADTLGMVIHKQEEKRAISGIASLLTLWAEGESKRSPIYEPPKRHRRKRTTW